MFLQADIKFINIMGRKLNYEHNLSGSWLLHRVILQYCKKLEKNFSCFLRNCINCVHNCEDLSSFYLINLIHSEV